LQYVTFLRSIVVFLLLLASAAAQTPAPEPPHPQQAPPFQPQASKEPPEHHITKAEADELFRAVDEILAFDSDKTGLPIKHAVKRKLTSRAEVQKFFLDSFRDDESAKRLKQAELVLKKFGLIPRESSLEGTLLALYTESVAGYYDPKTKTVYLLDWLDPESQKPVLAHELTHALQDQNFGIEKYLKTPKPNNKKYDVTSSEEMSARVAVMEGQAAAVMIDYLLAPRGLSVEREPDIARAVQNGMLSEGDAPIFAKAPLYLREDMKFPYTYGLNFTLSLLKESKEKAFGGAFGNPPENTRQVMEPEAYLKGEPVVRLPIPDLDKVLGKEWQRFDVDSVGEFDISVLAREYGKTVAQARSIAATWRNSYYYASTKKGVKAAKPEDISLLYVSRWGSPETAANFAEIYAGALGTRYKKVTPVEGEKGHWTTEGGDVFIQQQGDVLLVTESFDQATSEKLRSAALEAVGATKQ
jgi:outer membrane lipoprotein-sorting protein